MLNFLGILTGLAGPLTSVIGKILDLKTAKLNSTTEIEIAGINRELEEANNRKAILISQMGNRVVALAVGLFTVVLSIPSAVAAWKLIIWDKVIGSFYHCAGPSAKAMGEYCASFSTDPLSNTDIAMVMSPFVFYLGYRLSK